MVLLGPKIIQGGKMAGMGLAGNAIEAITLKMLVPQLKKNLEK